jgi:dTDP-4-dehydrorhamnose 3,5-epimerase
VNYQPLAIPDVVLITPQVFGDERGFFFETFRQRDFEQHCGRYTFVQDNHSKSAHGILRGLHYQRQQLQGKLVRVTRGEVFDVAVDVREQSPTYGQWVGVTLNETNKNMLWIPPGFAHGFYVISDSADFQYKCTDRYDPDSEITLAWDDPDIGIDWPLSGIEPAISEKDAAATRWAAFQTPFTECPA